MANKIDLTSIALAFYKMDDNLATTVVLDDTGQNDAAVSGGNSEDLNSDVSKTGSGAFNYSDGSPFVVAPQVVVPSTEFSIVFWAKDNVTFVNQAGRMLTVKDNLLELLITRSSVDPEDIAVRINSKAIPNISGITRGEFHHYALLHNSSGTGGLYIDNVLRGTVSATGFTGVSDDLHIGATDSGNTINFEGLIDGMMFFNRTLTSQERDAIYAQGRGVNSLIMNLVNAFPTDRTASYDPNKVWDEETKLWYASNTAIGADNLSRGSGRFGNKLIAVSDEGSVYFEDYT